MRRTAIILAVVIIAVIGLHAFRSYQTSLVTGRLEMNPKGIRIIAKKAGDSVATTVSADSSFSILLTKGIWQLEVERHSTEDPRRILFRRRVVFIDSIVIKESENMDLGNISTGM